MNNRENTRRHLKTVSLEEALLDFTRLLARPISKDALLSGLPLPNGILTPSLAIRAAERAGFDAVIEPRAINKISAKDCPTILIMSDERVVLIKNVENGIFFQHADAASDSIPLNQSDLEDHYSGDCLGLGVKPTRGTDAINSTHWFWSVIGRSKNLYREVLLASLLINLFALATPLFIMNVYDRVVPNQSLSTLWVLASGISLVLIFDLIMKSFRGYFLDVAGKRADLMLSSATFEHVLNMKMTEHPSRVGSFASQLQEFDQFRDFFTSTTLVTIIDLPFSLLFIALIFSIAGPLGLIPLMMLPLVVIIGYLSQRQLRPVIQALFSESSKKTAMLIETLHTLETIKALRAEGQMQARWESHQNTLATLGMSARLWSLNAINLVQAIQQSATVVLVIAGVYAIQAGELSVGGLIACTILTGRALAPMAQIATILTRYQHAIAAYSSIDRLMQLPGERDFKNQYLHRSTIEPSIEFKEVSFSYPNQSLPALRTISFKIDAGEKVGIIGPTGSGKTTIQRLISKLYLPETGSILIGNTDTNQIDPADLRKKISYLAQDFTLLAGSVRENLRLGLPDAKDETILMAAKLGGIKTYFDQHPEGYDFQIGERGACLSGGQRQGIAIARALINDAYMLLLDEPSNAMDSQAERHLIDRLSQHAKKRTLLLITHRMNMLQLVDRVIVLNQGRIVADGPREEILGQLNASSGAEK